VTPSQKVHTGKKKTQTRKRGISFVVREMGEGEKRKKKEKRGKETL